MSYTERGSFGPTVTVSREPDRSGNFVCNGTADDVQIQAAIDYIAVLGGGSIFLGEGTYTLATSLTIGTGNANLTITGSGWGTIIDGSPLGAGIYAILVGDGATTTNNLHISNMIIQGGVQFDDVTRARLSFIRFNGSGANKYNIEYVDECYHHSVEDCLINLGVLGGINIEADTTFLDISHNEFSNNLLYDIRVYHTATPQPRGIDIAFNWFERTSEYAGRPIYLYGADNVNVHDNHILQPHDDTYDMITMDGDDWTYKTWRCTIYSNYLIAITDAQVNNGIYLDYAGDNRIYANYIWLNAADNCIECTVNSQRNRFWENEIQGGTFVDAGTNNRVPEIFMPVIDPDSTVGDHPALVLPDTVDTTLRLQIPAHVGFQQIVTAQILVVQTSTGGPPDMQWSTTTDWGGIGVAENYNAGSDAETDQTTAVTQNRIVPIDVSGSLDGIDARDLVGFTFIRRASQAGDTINADAYYLGFRLRYV